MPYCNITGVTAAGIWKALKYLGNRGHEHHEEYEITAVSPVGVDDQAEFVARALQNAKKNANPAGGKRRGRPPANVANWFLIRVPDWTYLEDDEKRFLEKAAIEEFGVPESAAILFWHENLLNGSADLNGLATTFDRWGRLIRDRNSNPVAAMRRRFNAITDQLNETRQQGEREPIQTMRGIQAARSQQPGKGGIEVELAAMPVPPLKAADLEMSLISLGYEVPRFSLERDLISIKKPKREKPKHKKAKCKKPKQERAKHFSILALMNLVVARVAELRKSRHEEKEPLTDTIKKMQSESESDPQSPQI